MPTGNENLLGALISALIWCWDESIGYHRGATFNPDTDCSGFVWRALHENGFDVGHSRFDTTNEYNILVNAGFTPYVWGVDINTPQHGDIFMYDEGGGANGHTFFYAENVRGYKNGYLGYSNCNGEIAVCPKVRIEASSSRGHYYPGTKDPIPGDQPNDLGCHGEVWVHSYGGNTPVDDWGPHTWYVFRWGGDPPGPIPPEPPFPPGHLPTWFIKKLRDRNHHDNLNTLDQLFI